MGRKLGAMLSSSNWRHVVVAILALVGLGLIVYAGLVAWQRPCREHTGVGLVVGTPACPSLLLDLEPLLIALGFWAAGLVVWCAGQRCPTVAFFLLGAGVLAAGKLSALGSDVGGRLFYLLFAWVAPMTFHFHFDLLDRSPRRVGQVVLRVLYSLAVAWSLPALLWTRTTLQQRGWFAAWRAGVRLSVALALALTALLLLRDYRRRASPAARQRTRLITFGTAFAFTPLLLLSLLPDTLGAVYVPYELTFPWLLLSPLAYAYSLFRHRLVRTEAALSRVAVYYLLVTLLLGIYVAAAAALGRFTASPAGRWPLASAVLSVGLLLLFAPLQRVLRRLLNWILYGGEVSYASVVGRLAESLSLTLDRETLRRLLVDELASAMRLSTSALFVRDQDDTLIPMGATGFEPGAIAACRLPGDCRLAAYLEGTAGPLPDARVRRALAGMSLCAGEQALLCLTGVALWLPLASGGVLQGLLLMGPRPGGDFFTAEDERILATLACQSGIAAHNVRLTEQVRAGRQELARAHQQLLAGRERERQRLAQELHDGAVQWLVGISYQLADGRRRACDRRRPDVQRVEEVCSALEDIRQEVLGVGARLRQLIGELRPAGLEELGLTTALEGYVAHLEREGGPEMPEIELDLDDSGTALPEPVALCLFRVAQEALRNSLKHARPTRILLRLRLLADEAVLSVCDDGCGFQVPARLSVLTQADHFGLVGIAEQVSWAGGQLTIRSQPGAGTEVAVRIPLNEAGRDGG